MAGDRACIPESTDIPAVVDRARAILLPVITRVYLALTRHHPDTPSAHSSPACQKCLPSHTTSCSTRCIVRVHVWRVARGLPSASSSAASFRCSSREIGGGYDLYCQMSSSKRPSSAPGAGEGPGVRAFSPYQSRISCITMSTLEYQEGEHVVANQRQPTRLRRSL